MGIKDGISIDIDRISIAHEDEKHEMNQSQSAMRMMPLLPRLLLFHLYNSNRADIWTPIPPVQYKINASQLQNQWYTNKSVSTQNGNRNDDTATVTIAVPKQLTPQYGSLKVQGKTPQSQSESTKEGYKDGPRATECLTSKITMKQWIHQRENPKHYTV